jgi:hypothetical protein
LNLGLRGRPEEHALPHVKPASKRFASPRAVVHEPLRDYASEYEAGATPSLIEIRPAHYLTIYGSGEPGVAAFRPRIKALSVLARGLRRSCREQGADFAIGAVEGLFWGTGLEGKFLLERPKTWQWMLCLRVPPCVRPELVLAVAERFHGVYADLPLDEVRLKCLNEGLCIQATVEGRHGEETEAIKRMQEFAEASGLVPRGPHHEIRFLHGASGEGMHTLLRQPVKRVVERTSAAG